jgi:hypothetical protein
MPAAYVKVARDPRARGRSVQNRPGMQAGKGGMQKPAIGQGKVWTRNQGVLVAKARPRHQESGGSKGRACLRPFCSNKTDQ